VTARRGVRPRSRRRAVLTLVLAPVLCGIMVAGVASAAWIAVGSPDLAAGAVWFQATRFGSVRFTNPPTAPFFALIVGTGARADNPADSPGDPGLADAVHVIGVNPALNAGTIIDIPRDTEGPGGAKINSYIVNNPNNDLRTMADAVQSLTGAPITYVMRVNFPHFVQMIDEIGGVDVNITQRMDDPTGSGADFLPGFSHLTGDQALAFSRDRHSFSNGDLSRSENQGLLILGALGMLRARNPSFGDTVRLVATAGRHTKLDNLSIGELFRLGQYALTLDPNNIKNVVLPVANSGNGSNLAKTGDAAGLLADFTDDAVLQTH
jgi:polyisoprenyl-teichoic acid--peptidoglycan teichoic acid transferase